MLDFGAFSIFEQCDAMKKRKASVYDARYQQLIEWLVHTRKKQGITQEELAARLGISRQNISKIELGQRRLDVLELNDWLCAIGLELQLLDAIHAKLEAHASL